MLNIKLECVALLEADPHDANCQLEKITHLRFNTLHFHYQISKPNEMWDIGTALTMLS